MAPIQNHFASAGATVALPRGLSGHRRSYEPFALVATEGRASHSASRSERRTKAFEETFDLFRVSSSALELDNLDEHSNLPYSSFPEMLFRDLPKSVRRSIRELAKTAHERELAAELHQLDALFVKWRAGILASQELSDAIHEFHDGPSRRLWTLYTASDPSLAVASAIARGVLPRIEVPLDVAQELHATIAALSEHTDEPAENDDA